MRVHWGLFVLSAAALAFEINLTRLFSVAQFYHFAFMIVSLALLGFGASGSALALFPNWGRRRPERALAWLGLGFGLSAVGSYALINLLPFDSFRIAWDRRQVGVLVLHYLALATPFFCSGAAVGLLLSARPAQAGRTYFVNLLGSATGALLALALPGWVGGEGVVLVSAGLGAGSALALVGIDLQRLPRLRQGLLPLVSLLLVVGCLAGLISLPPFMRLHLSPYKDLSHALLLPDAEILWQRWNAFSRVTLLQSSAIRSLPGLSYRYPGPLPPQRGLTVDGDDLSAIVQGVGEPDLAFSDYMPGGLAYRLRPGASALLLESHGGLDLVVARAQGATEVVAVAPNSLVVAAADAIYNLPGVQLRTETGRSYSRRAGQRFDVVTLSLNTPYRPVRSGAYSLAENYAYTVEAFGDYLSRLAPGGIFQATRWLQTPPSEETRLFALGLTALEGQGVDPAEGLLFFRGYNTATLLVKPDGFDPAELEAARAWLSERAFDLIYAPDVEPGEVNRYNKFPEPVYYQAALGLLAAPDRGAWYEAFPFDVTPPRDDHPFFGHFFKWEQTSQVLREMGKTWQPFGGAGYFVLLALLALAAAAALAVILLPLLLGRLVKGSALAGGTGGRGLRLATLAYFGLIGLGFLFVEIPLFQRFILFLGQPVYGLTAVLFALLFFSGLGSRASGRLPHRGGLLALIGLVLVYPLLLPRLFDLFLGWPLPGRLLVALLALGPLGFLLGLPLPLGVGLLERRAPGLIPWAWGVNGAASVISSVGAALLALSWGFSWVLVIGAGCYGGALAAQFALSRGE